MSAPSPDPVTRFDGHAANYAASELHQDSPSIRRLHALVDLPPRASLCDVACGTGHLGLSFAGRVGRLVGVDPAPRMLAAFEAAARARGVEVECVLSRAESVPLPDASFDFVASRLAPHHFRDVRAAVREMARVTKPGGQVAVIDLVGHDDPEVDELNHVLEVLHDPTHQRSYRAGEWRGFLEQAGLEVVALETGSERPQGVTVRRWCEVAASGAEAEAAIRARLRAAPPAMLRALDVREQDGELYVTSRSVLALARKR